MIDAGLAELYGVPAKALNQAVKRNAGRFPPDFMLQRNAEECSIVLPTKVALKQLNRREYAAQDHQPEA